MRVAAMRSVKLSGGLPYDLALGINAKRVCIVIDEPSSGKCAFTFDPSVTAGPGNYTESTAVITLRREDLGPLVGMALYLAGKVGSTVNVIDVTETDQAVVDWIDRGGRTE